MKLGVQQQSVIGLAKRNSERLTLYKAIIFYREKGFTNEQIFFKEEAKETVPIISLKY